MANYGFGEIAGKSSDASLPGRYLTYDNGPVSVGLAAEQLKQNTLHGNFQRFHQRRLDRLTCAPYDFGAAAVGTYRPLMRTIRASMTTRTAATCWL